MYFICGLYTIIHNILEYINIYISIIEYYYRIYYLEHSILYMYSYNMLYYIQHCIFCRKYRLYCEMDVGIAGQTFLNNKSLREKYII